MLWGLLLVAVLAATFGPAIWVRWVMRSHGSDIAGMPGSGGELAEHLVERFALEGVVVERTDKGDHYDPNAKAVRLSPSNYDGKSLTAIAVATHEVGHAIQDHEGDPRLARRTALVPLADRVGRISVGAMWAAPVIGLLTRHPLPFSVLVILGLSGFVARMLVHAHTLPIEWDASFNKAMPILEEGQYVHPNELPKVRKILKAAAYTYAAAALADVLNLTRWAAILLRR
jgi:Zn-dependent membrane protease YugP